MQLSVQKRKDILNYLGTFFISQISFMDSFVPIVIGFIEKRENENQKKFILYGLSILTVIFKFSLNIGFVYFINIILISVLFEFIKVKNIKNANVRNIVLFLTVLTLNVSYRAFWGVVLYDVIMAIVLSSLTVVSYNFFERFDFDFEEIDEKNFLMLTALAGIILSTINDVSIFNINLRNVFAIYIVLSFAYLKNIKYAVLSGLIIGTIGEMVNANMGLFIISLTLGGFIAALFKEKGKIATISGFILGNSILAYYLIGYNLLIAKFFEIIFAGMLMIFSEKKLQIATNLFVDSMCILKSSEHKKEAELFINFMCEPEVAAMNAETVGYATPNTEAQKMLDPEITGNNLVYPDDEYLKNNTEVFINLPQKTQMLQSTLWTDLKIISAEDGSEASAIDWIDAFCIIVIVAGGISAIYFFIRNTRRKKLWKEK